MKEVLAWTPREMLIFDYSTMLSKELEDELGHINYNELKKILETVRHSLCKFLGFGRKNLRQRLSIGLFMRRDTYEYYKPLKAGDLVTFYPRIKIVGPTQITIRLRVVRMSPGPGQELTNEAIYEMIMVNLKTQRPVRISKAIIDSIERFQKDQEYLCSVHVVPPPETKT